MSKGKIFKYIAKASKAYEIEEKEIVKKMKEKYNKHKTAGEIDAKGNKYDDYYEILYDNYPYHEVTRLKIIGKSGHKYVGFLGDSWTWDDLLGIVTTPITIKDILIPIFLEDDLDDTKIFCNSIESVSCLNINYQKVIKKDGRIKK